ncbi:MAG: hypothetical protein ACYCT2_09170 [Thermoplasmataceae archaeon]
MTNYGKLRNDQDLAYSSMQLIHRVRQVYEVLPSGLYFNKGLSFINSEMKKKGYKIGLPHCWYRWGDEVVRYQMPSELSWTHEEASYTEVNWIGSPVTLQDEDRRKDMDKLIDRFVSDYPLKTDGTLELLLADHYDRAPFEFQRRYKVVRDMLFDRTISAGRSNNPSGNNLMLPLLQNAFESFPKEKLFKPVADLIPAFTELMKYLSSGYVEEFKTVNEVSEEFWYWFCYFLRIHPAAHENVNESTLAFWRSELNGKTETFIRNFEDHVLSSSKKYEEISRNDLLSPYLEMANKRAISFAETLEGFDETMSDLDEFLSDRINIG